MALPQAQFCSIVINQKSQGLFVSIFFPHLSSFPKFQGPTDNPILASKLVHVLKIPQPTLSELHSKQPFHGLRKLRVNFTKLAPIAFKFLNPSHLSSHAFIPKYPSAFSGGGGGGQVVNLG